MLPRRDSTLKLGICGLTHGNDPSQSFLFRSEHHTWLWWCYMSNTTVAITPYTQILCFKTPRNHLSPHQPPTPHINRPAIFFRGADPLTDSSSTSRDHDRIATYRFRYSNRLSWTLVNRLRCFQNHNAYNMHVRLDLDTPCEALTYYLFLITCISFW